MNDEKYKFNVRVAISALIIFATLQSISAVFQLMGAHGSRHHAIDNLERRVVLDSAFLDIGNATLLTPVNSYAVKKYLKEINGYLAKTNYPARVKSIQAVSQDSFSQVFSVEEEVLLTNAEQEISVTFASMPLYSQLSFSVWSFFLALLVAPLYAVKQSKVKVPVESEAITLPPQPKLVINLRDKTLGNGVNGTTVVLQNKPLCFYTALIKYCAMNPEQALPPHKDVPGDLIILANKTFGRLIELGHTKRKRPDFNANLDKTLSEIRAALDEVFNGYSVEKERYYPPRAQGEGSRSKQHSYALTQLSLEDVEIIGN